MSDIFSILGSHYDTLRDAQARQYRANLENIDTNYAAERDELHAGRMEGIRQRNERAEKLREQYGFDYSIGQYAALAGAIDDGIIGEDQGYDILAAQTISDNLRRQGVSIDPVEIYQNLPEYSAYILGDREGLSARTPKTNLAAILGSFVVSGANFQKNILGWQLAAARNQNNTEMEALLLERLRQEDAQIDEYSDFQQRNFLVEAAKFAAQSSAYTLFVTAGGLLGGMPGAFIAGMTGAAGQTYLGLDAAGVNHEIAWPMALGLGAVNALIESHLGNAAGLVGRVSGASNLQASIAKRAAAFVSDKLHLSGAALKMATGPVARYVLEGVGELSEEAFGEISDIVGTELAAFLQKEGVQLDRDDYVARIAEAAKAGFMSSLFLGVPGLAIDTVSSIGDLQRIRSDADTIQSEAVFKEQHKDSPLRGSMSEEDWDKELSKIFQGRQSIREAEEERVAEGLRETAGLGAGYAERQTRPETGEPIPLGTLYRRHDGRLYTELDERAGVFKAGDARVQSDTNLDAHIKYRTGEDGRVIIEEFHVRPDRESSEYRREFFKDFAESLAGKGFSDIAWNPTTETGVTIRQDLIDNNPYGKGLNYFDGKLEAAEQWDASKGDTAGAARMKVAFGEQMAQALPGSTEASRMAAMRLIDRIGRSYDLSFDRFIEKLGFEPGAMFTNTPGEAVREENARAHNLAAQFAKGGNPRAVRGALQPWKKLDADMKAVEHSIVYLDPERADFSTVIHELKHAVDNFLEKYDKDLFKRMMDAAGDYDTKSGMDENTWRRERSAYAFETYLETGKAPAPELRNLFQQMKELLKDLIKSLSGMRRLTSRQTAVFDELFSRADRAASDADTVEATRIAQEARTGAETGKDTVGSSGNVPGAVTVPDGYDDIEAWVKTLPEKDQRLYRENKALNENRESLDKNKGIKPVIEGVGAEDLEGLKAKATEGHDFIRDLANKWAKKWDDSALGRPGFEAKAVLKGDKRAIEKHIEEATPYNEMLDMVGFTVVVKDLKTLLEMAKEVREDEAVVRVKDRYRPESSTAGYCDFLLNIKAPNGFVGEIQLNIEQMYAAKEKFGGHVLYEARRSLTTEEKNGNINSNTVDKDQKTLGEISEKFYGKARGLVYAGAQVSASSLDMRSPSFSAYTSKNGEGNNVLSEFTANNLDRLLAQTLSRHSTNLSDGSSKSGTSTAGTEEVKLSGAAEAEITESSFTSVPSTNNISQNRAGVNTFAGNNSSENERRIEKARAKWEAAERTQGAEDQLTLQTGAEISGHYELGEAGISTPSVDPDDGFTQSEGFPVNNNGTSMNVGRDYTGGFSREAAVRMASDFDQRGIGIIVDSNGITGSGNNRDISRRLAAKNGTDGKYTAYLASRPERWGFTKEDVAKYKHPTLYFVVDAPASYSPLYFDQFNRSGKKSVSPLETAIKMSYLVSTNKGLVNEFASVLGNYESIGELYEDTQAATGIFQSLLKKGIVTENSYPDYVESLTIKGKRQERVTSAGKDFLESVMLGAVLEEDSIRSLALVPEIRRRIIKGLAVMVDNAALGEYSIIAELNQAVAVAVEVAANKKKYASIEDYANQRELSLGQRVSTDIEVELAGRLLERTEYAFADTMGGLNALLREEARGQGDMFGGTSKDEILRRYLGIKARVEGIREANNKIIANEGAETLEKVVAAMDNAGLAKGEADGTLFQTAYHGSPHRFDRFDSSHMGSGEGQQAFGWGLYFAGNRKIADHYREALSDIHYFEGDRELHGNEAWAAQFLFSWKDRKQRVTKEEAIERVKELFKPEKQQEFISLIEKLDNENLRNEEGLLYEVEIPDDEDYLDWDIDFWQQSDYIQSSFTTLIEDALQYEDMSEKEVERLHGTGKELYEGLVEIFGDPEKVSRKLLHYGILGIRYLDGSSRSDGEGSHNYVIFDDSDIEITKTYYQLDDQLVEEAAGYDKWQEFRNTFDDSDIEVTKTYYQLEEEAANNAWYRSVWNDSRKIYNTLFQGDEEKTSRAVELDRRFYKGISRAYLTNALRTINSIINDKTLSEEPGEGEDRGEYDRIKRLEKRIRHELPQRDVGTVIGMAGQVGADMELSGSSQYGRLKKMIREHIREYRSVFADIMEQDEFLADLADTADGEPHAGLADPRAVRMNTFERLKEIARELGDSGLEKAIENGEITMDSPLVTAFEAGEKSGYRKNTEALKTLEKEMGEDFARLEDTAKQRMITLYEDMLLAKERLTVRNDKLERMLKEGISITTIYQRQARREQATYDQAYKAFTDYAKARGIEADVREALARRDARYDERIRQQGFQKRRRALAALKEIKRTLIKRIIRNVSFETIAYKQAAIIKAVQRIFEPSIFEGANAWIGSSRGPLLREVWSAWSTDETYQDKMTEAAGEKRAPKIAAILNKDWDFITTAEKKTLIKLLPKENFVKDLILTELFPQDRESVQLDIEERVIDGRAYYVLGTELERDIKEALGLELYNRIQNKPLSEWSIVEVEELAGFVDRYTVEGRRELRAKKEAKQILEQRYRNEIIAALRNTGIEITDTDSPEEKERKEKKIEKILYRYASGKKRNTLFNNFFDANLRRFTTTLDGGRKGIFTNLLYWGENDAYNNEQRMITSRRMRIETAMKENNISLDELYQSIEIPGLKEVSKLNIDLFRISDGTITVDDLLYILRGYENEETRKAITYGLLSNAEERGHYEKQAESLDDITAFANKAQGRLMLVMDFAKEFFARTENKKFLTLLNAIGDDYDRNGERMNRACIEMFNRPMWRVDNYVPMNRREQSGGENENRVIEDFLGVSGAGQQWVNRGMTEKRITISPYHQAPIELGLYKTWAQSVVDTEHLLAYGPLVQTLNGVFKGYGTSEVSQTLNDRFGQAATKRISDTIAKFANPDPVRQRTGLDTLVRSLRGKTATAYLAYRVSSVLKQFVSSPWPYLQEIAPSEYLKACLDVAGGLGTKNNFIREKSIFMKNRDFDPMVKLIRESRAKNDSQKFNQIRHGIDRLNALGMKGLEAVDWACVAPGWLAVYRRELANVAREQEAEYQRLLEKYRDSSWNDVLPTEESKTNKALSEVMNEEAQDAEAVARADDAVRRMQPSGRPVDMAPLFDNRSEVANAFLQFQASLNVIWQNIRYDLPLAVKEGQVMTVLGMVTGYAAAGVLLGLLTDDDKEKEKQERNTAAWILYNSLTQFTDAVPVIGDGINAFSEKIITGKTGFHGQQNLLPVVNDALSGLQNLAGIAWEEDSEKQKQRLTRAMLNLTEALGTYLGLPVSGVKELGRTISIGDGDGDLAFNPESFLGRR